MSCARREGKGRLLFGVPDKRGFRPTAAKRNGPTHAVRHINNNDCKAARHLGVCCICALTAQRLTTYLSRPSLQCLWIALLAIGACHASTDYSVIAAVNVGGGPLTAASGIRYEADNEQLGTVSNAGKRHVISVAPVEDQALFETCRHMACVCASCYKRSCNILAWTDVSKLPTGRRV